MNCFAYSKKDGCKVLLVKACLGERCGFRKTKAQARADRRRSAARIASLDIDQRLYIADKYYAGKLPTPKEEMT